MAGAAVRRLADSTARRVDRTLRRTGRTVRHVDPTVRRAGGTAPRSREQHPVLPDHHGAVPIEYAPELDGQADPGEIVWTWVAYEDDPTRGKDRPVLVVGREGGALLALMLTSKDHDRDAADEARWGRVWMDIGSGPWDPRRRPSEVRLDRVLRLDPAQVRREGAVVDRALFDRVVQAMASARRA